MGNVTNPVNVISLYVYVICGKIINTIETELLNYPNYKSDFELDFRDVKLLV